MCRARGSGFVRSSYRSCGILPKQLNFSSLDAPPGSTSRALPYLAGFSIFGDSSVGSPFFVCGSLVGKRGIGRGLPGGTGAEVVHEWGTVRAAM